MIQVQDVQNAQQLLDMEEFTFAPSIINVKGVTSTMGDFMRSWSEKRELHLHESRSERFLLEREEFPFRPELPAKSTNDELLRCAGYSGPIQAWRKHAEHYKQMRSSDNEASDEPRKDRQKTGNLTPWTAVVQRLYPFSSNENAASPAEISSPVLSKAASPDSRFSGALGMGQELAKARDMLADDGVSSFAASPPDESSGAPGMPGQRRCGRPPKATWQFLYESGTRQIRGKSMPPRVESNTTPTPLPHSKQLLKREASARRPLYQKGPQIASQHATQPEKIPAASSTQPERPRSSGDGVANAGQRLYEQSERQKAFQEQRQILAGELKMAEEMRECTFQPQIERLNCDRRGHKSKSNGTTPIDESSLSLYERGLRARQRRQQMEETGVQKRTEVELRECTFHPTVRRKKGLARDTSFASQPSPSSGSASMCQDDVCIEADVSQANDVSSKVLTMLDDWRGRYPSHDIGQLHGTTHFSQEPSNKLYTAEKFTERSCMLDENLQRRNSSNQPRHEDLSSEVQALLEN